MENTTTTTALSRRHGSPYDRGAADAYYGRMPRPHYFLGGSNTSAKVETLSEEEVAEYLLGYNEQDDRKEWR